MSTNCGCPVSKKFNALVPNIAKCSRLLKACRAKAKAKHMLVFHILDLNAPNVQKIGVDPALLEPLRPHLISYLHNPEFHVQYPP